MNKETNMSFETFEDIINYAIEKEKEAVEFYSEISKKAPLPNQREILEGFSAEEKKHQALFENFGKDKGKIESYDFKWIPDIKRSNYIVDMDYEEGMDYVDLLRLAMKREEKSLQMYNDMLEKADQEDLKNILKMLCQEEAGHKQKLETIYDDYMAKQGD
jgi:rubrerythrin